MSKIFNSTKSDEEWLFEEDKKLYQNQVKFNGSFGYITNKKPHLGTIDPSKRKLQQKLFNESCEPSTTMIVEAPEYDSSDGLSSANITNIKDEPPDRYRWQMTKKAVEIVTRPKGFLQKKHPAFSPKSVMEQQRPDSLQYEKESSEWVWSKRDLQNWQRNALLGVTWHKANSNSTAILRYFRKICNMKIDKNYYIKFLSNNHSKLSWKY